MSDMFIYFKTLSNQPLFDVNITERWVRVVYLWHFPKDDE